MKTINDFNAMDEKSRKQIARRACERYALTQTLKDKNVIAIRDTYRANIDVEHLKLNIIAIMNAKKNKTNVNENALLEMLNDDNNE